MVIKTKNCSSLQKKIAKIELTDTKRSEKILKILVPFAKEYIKGKNNEFADFLNKNESFKAAKKRLIKKQLIPSNDNFLELLCANIIKNFNIERIQNAVVPQKKINSIRNSTEKLKIQLESIDGCVFESEIVQFLLQSLLTMALESPHESVLNSGAKHSKLLRENFIKKIIYKLVQKFDGKNLTPTFFADITISVTPALFTEPVDRSDCINKVKKIKNIALQDKNLMTKTVKDLLIEYFNKRQK